MVCYTAIVNFAVVNLKYGPDDYFVDHVAVSELVFLAAFAETVLHYELQQSEAYQVLSIDYIEYFKLLRYEPEECVDISKEMEMKLEILACHKSRIVWLNDRDDKDVLAAPPDLCQSAQYPVRYYLCRSSPPVQNISLTRRKAASALRSKLRKTEIIGGI